MRALITGVSSGIGLGIARHLQAAGWSITGVDLVAPEEKWIEFHKLDLSELDSVMQFTQTTSTTFDAFIYCAGIREICDPCQLSIAEWSRVLNVNLNSAFILSQALIKTSLQQKQPLSIVYLSSISGIQAEPNRAAYVTSKFGLIGLTKQFAFQFGKYGVRTNAIAPGIIETPLTQSYFADPCLVEKIKESTPVGHWGTIEHIIPLIDICLTNTYMNGSVLVCDGGWTTGKDL